MTNVSPSDAIRSLFGINLSSESPYLKDKINSFIRNKLIKTITEPGVQRGRIYLKDEQQKTVLFNSLILNAFFCDPKDVKKIFTDKVFRTEAADTIKFVLTAQDSTSGIIMQPENVTSLIKFIAGDEDLYTERLPNPFKTLPQVALGKNSGLLHQLLIRASSLQPLDSALYEITCGNWRKADSICNQLDCQNPGVDEIKQMVKAKLNEAQEFDDLLDFLRVM